MRVLLSNNFFSFGRPLWGAVLGKHSVRTVANLADAKIRRGRKLTCRNRHSDETEALALISYRMNFDVALFSLAEKLTSGYLRCIVDINVERTLLRTTQPSEPILAFLSAEKLLHDRESRLRAVKALYENTTKGFIHLGDIGEAVAALVLLFTFDKVHHAVNGKWPAPVRLSTLHADVVSKQQAGHD